MARGAVRGYLAHLPEAPGWRGARRRWLWGWPARRICDWLARKHPTLRRHGAAGPLTPRALYNHAFEYGWPDRRSVGVPTSGADGVVMQGKRLRKDPRPRRYRCHCGGVSLGRPVHSTCERRVSDWTAGGSLYGPGCVSHPSDAMGEDAA